MGITSSNNGSEAAGIINAALQGVGSSVTIGNESGESVSDKLNGVFGDDLLDETQSGSEWAASVDAGFDGIETDGIKFKFLHLSDPHGYADAVEFCKNRMSQNSDIKFTFITGDVCQYNTAVLSTALATQMDAIPSGKLMLNAGNHDTYDMSYNGSASQQTATNYIKHYLGNNVNYGDSGGKASYWYKDYPIGTNKLRIISLDQYETGNVRFPSANYFTMYSQAQITWFINLLKGLSANDYLIVATHEPPVQSRSVPQGESTGTYPDEYAVGLRPTTNQDTAKLFVTEGLTAFGNRRTEPNINLLPMIMDAYINGKSLSMTYNNQGGGSTPDITINEDFSQVNPCTFLFWLGGHRHADICTYLPNESNETDGGDWSDQLMLYIAAASVNSSYSYDDDLGGSGSLVTPIPTNSLTYRVNEVELDFDNETITVTRYGSKNTSAGRERTSVEFPFKKTSE